MSDRPSDALQPSSKRRPGAQLTKDDCDADDDGPSHDPGTWTAASKADKNTLAKRKIIRARRGGPPAEAGPPTDEPSGAPNPFAGIALSTVIAAPAATNPFAGVSLTTPAAATKEPEQEQAGPSKAAQDAQEASGKPSAVDAPQLAGPAAQQAVQATSRMPDGSAVADMADKAITPDESTAAGAANKEVEDQPGHSSKPAIFGAGSGGGFGSLGSGAGGFGGFSAVGASGFASIGASGSTAGIGGFGSVGAAAGGASGFGGFGGFATSASAPAFGAGGCSGSLFGSLAAAKSPDKDGQHEGDEEGAGEQHVFAEPAPVVTLEEVPKQTGEEGEQSLFKADGALFEYTDNQWRERGKGEFRINLSQAGKARMVMRQRGTAKLLLNAMLFPSMTTAVMQGGAGVTFGVNNVAAAEAGEQGDGAEAAAGSPTKGSKADLRTYGLRIKKQSLIDQFQKVVEKHKAAGDEAAATGGAQPDAADNV